MLIALRFPYSFLEISCSIEKSITRTARLTIEKTLKFSCFMAKAKFAQCYSAHSHWAACACIIHVAMETWLDWPPGVWLAWTSLLLSVLQNTCGKWRCRSALVKLNGNAGVVLAALYEPVLTPVQLHSKSRNWKFKFTEYKAARFWACNARGKCCVMVTLLLCYWNIYRARWILHNWTSDDKYT